MEEDIVMMTVRVRCAKIIGKNTVFLFILNKIYHVNELLI